MVGERAGRPGSASGTRRPPQPGQYNDMINDDVDERPLAVSNRFSDRALGGQTSGQVAAKDPGIEDKDGQQTATRASHVCGRPAASAVTAVVSAA